MAAVPSIGRATSVEHEAAPEAELTHGLYERHADQIFRYCLHQLGSREEAEDAVQSTFLNAFRGLKRGVVPELESAWLFKIAHNVCLSRRRSAWRRGRVEAPTDFDLVEELTPAPPRRADELIGLQDVLEQLPATQRRAILLRLWLGLSYREIAEELDLSQAAVETLIFRARRSLASGLEQPQESRRQRIARALDLGNLLAALKAALLGGAGAAKVAATVAVVGAVGAVAAGPVERHFAGGGSPAPAAKVPAKVGTQHRAATTSSRPVPATVAPTRPQNATPLTHRVVAKHVATKRAHGGGAPTGRTAKADAEDVQEDVPEQPGDEGTKPAAPAAKTVKPVKEPRGRHDETAAKPNEDDPAPTAAKPAAAHSAPPRATEPSAARQSRDKSQAQSQSPPADHGPGANDQSQDGDARQ